MTGKTVVRVIIEDGRATGVEFYESAGDQAGHTQLVRAKKQVVLTAGAFGSPVILERSGVGNKKVLEKAGIDIKVELPGVGSEYRNHQVNHLALRPNRSKEKTDRLIHV